MRTKNINSRLIFHPTLLIAAATAYPPPAAAEMTGIAAEKITNGGDK